MHLGSMHVEVKDHSQIQAKDKDIKTSIAQKNKYIFHASFRIRPSCAEKAVLVKP